LLVAFFLVAPWPPTLPMQNPWQWLDAMESTKPKPPKTPKTKEQRREQNRESKRVKREARRMNSHLRPPGKAPDSMAGNRMEWDPRVGSWIDIDFPDASEISWRTQLAPPATLIAAPPATPLAPSGATATPLAPSGATAEEAVMQELNHLCSRMAEVSLQMRQGLERDWQSSDDGASEASSGMLGDDEGDSQLDESDGQVSGDAAGGALHAAAEALADEAEAAPVDHRGIPRYQSAAHATVRAYVTSRLGATEVRLAALRADGDADGHATLSHVIDEPLLKWPPHYWTRRQLLWRNPIGHSIAYINVIDEAVVQAAMRHVPASVYPASRDATADELAVQLGQCTLLDDIHVLKKGSGKNGARVRLNATSYPQPRRVSWSVVVESRRWSAEHEKHVRRLYSYSQAYRLPTDWRAVPMPKDVFALGVACWKAAWGELSAMSKQMPPTGCQLLVYQTLFNSTIGRHRDNGLTVDGKDARLGFTEDENSQIRGTSVLVFTVGPPMDVALVVPPPGKPPWKCKKVEYRYDARLVASLGSGSLYVLDPIDDENTCHQAWFKPETIRLGADVRLAFCYRWLSKAHEFFSDEHGELRDALAPTPEIIEAAAKRERERKRRAALRRKRGF
jgi:hypothetical protein